MRRWSRIAPTAAPPSWAALARGLLAAVRPPSGGASLSAELRRLFPDSAVVTYGLGRAALADAIRIACRTTGRDRVVLPAYTSYSVAAAAAAAGATADLCDLDPVRLTLDRASLARCVDHRTAAVVLGNPYGYPDRTDDLAWLRDAGVLLIDDAAQAIGATEGGRAVGGRGDLGVLSFGRGKCVSTGQGGALLIHAPALRTEAAPRDRATGAGAAAWLVAASLGMSTDPRVFGLLSRLPGVRVGESWYEPEFDAGPPPRSVEGLGSDLGAAIERHVAARRRIASQWLGRLTGVPGVATVPEQDGVRPAYLRVPVLAPDAARREKVVRVLARSGFHYVRSFPAPLGAIPEYRRHCGDRTLTPNAETVASRLIALPCHVGIRERDIRRAADCLRKAEP